MSRFSVNVTFFRVLLIRLLLILTTCTTPVRLQFRTETSRSSTVSTTEDYVLKGYCIHKQRSYDFLSCAHLCLARSNCVSFNYENIRNGICELNREVSNINMADGNALSSQRGYLFCHFVSAVSIALLTVIYSPPLM